MLYYLIPTIIQDEIPLDRILCGRSLYIISRERPRAVTGKGPLLYGFGVTAMWCCALLINFMYPRMLTV